MEYKFNPKAVKLVKLTEIELSDLAIFNCGDSEMNEFFREYAFSEQQMGMNTTILLYYMGELAAACSICCDAIPLSKTEKDDEGIPYPRVPAIKVARLGRSIKFRDCKFGKFFVEYIKQLAYELNEDTVGVRFLTLDAYSNKVGYYKEELGFIENEAVKSKEGRPVSMRADIFD